jgi:hypothetical protein
MRQVDVVVDATVMEIGSFSLKVFVGARSINGKGDQWRLASRIPGDNAIF